MNQKKKNITQECEKKHPILELEQNILDCWKVCDDIDLVWKEMYDGNPEPTEDQIANAMIGLNQIYEWKFQRLWNNFEEVLKRNSEPPDTHESDDENWEKWRLSDGD